MCAKSTSRTCLLQVSLAEILSCCLCLYEFDHTSNTGQLGQVSSPRNLKTIQKPLTPAIISAIMFMYNLVNMMYLISEHSLFFEPIDV